MANNTGVTKARFNDLCRKIRTVRRKETILPR